MASATLRGYIPTSTGAAAARWTDGVACAAGAAVFTVTDADRAAQVRPDEEALEYAAFSRAADVAAEAEDAALVLSADLAPHEIAGGALVSDLPVGAVVSFHVGPELLWYDVTEAADILGD